MRSLYRNRQPPESTPFPYTTLFRSGWLSGITVGMGHKNVELRLHQYGLATDPVARLDIAREIVAGKIDRKSTRLNSSHVKNSYAVFCLKKKKKKIRLRQL